MYLYKFVTRVCINSEILDSQIEVVNIDECTRITLEDGDMIMIEKAISRGNKLENRADFERV